MESQNNINEPFSVDPYHLKQDEVDRQAQELLNNAENPDDEIENSEMKKQAVDKEQPEVEVSNDEVKDSVEPNRILEESPTSWSYKIPVLGQAKWAIDSAALGVGDFAFDAIGLVPWLKPAEEWWDNNSLRSNHPAHKIVRDSSSVIIPSLIGGAGLVSWGSKATKMASIPSWTRTLGTVATYTGVDTTVAMISSHSKSDDNLAASLNNWLGWNIPWATRASDSPDVRWKKNVLENSGLSAGVELLGVTFSLAKKAKLFPKDDAADIAITARNAELAKYPDPATAAVETSRAQRKAAQRKKMIEILQDDPTGQNGYNAFVNDIGEDSAGRAVANIDIDPLMSKLDQVRIQNNLDTLNGRAANVASESLQTNLRRAINGNERAQQLDQLFTSISPSFDAVVENGDQAIKISSQQMNQAVDNLTQATYGADLSFGEYQALVDNMTELVFDSNRYLDTDQWTEYSKGLENAYRNMFDPNKMRASAMLTQQTGDSIADIATAAKMIGDEADTSRQFQMMFEKLNLLDTEMRVNKYVFSKAQEYKHLLQSGNSQAAVSWIRNQANDFDKYLSRLRYTNQTFTDNLWQIAKDDYAYFEPLKTIFAETNGNVDQIHKLKRYMDSKLGLIKKGFIDGEPQVSSVIVKGLHAARIFSLLSGMSTARAAIGNSILTALKPASILAGAKLTGNDAVFKRATYTYGGIIENFKRGFKVMESEWNFANSFPDEAMMRGRVDLQKAKMETLEKYEGMAEIWRRDGDNGKLMMWNLAKGLTWWTKQNFVKYGTNALYAVDGFTNSFQASGIARARAYDEVMHANRGAVSFDDMFKKTQKNIYNQMFDETGLLTDEAAKHATREIALNLDNPTVNALERFLDHVPAARGVFLFPRTGANAFDVGWSFAPMSNLGPAMTRARRVLGANTGEAKMAALAEHGLDSMENTTMAFETLKSEYIGRQIMGSGIIMGIGAWALEGNVTGSGPQNDAERRRMVAMGWKPFSIKNPITGEWRSYKGLEPFAQIIGLTADMVYAGQRVDQAFLEDGFRKLGFAISMNITNNTFIGGLQPLVGLISSDPSAWTRFFAQQTDMLIPYKGVRSVLNNAISPQLRDVKNDFFSQLKNQNKWLFNKDSDDLAKMVDIYTGDPIRSYDIFTNATNALLPMFKSNGGVEPWRQWLLSTGWDRLQRIRRDPYTQQPLEPYQRQYINNWIGKNANLKNQIIDLMTRNEGWWEKKMEEYRQERGQLPQTDLPLKEFIVHRELDKIHDRAFDAAWSDYNKRFDGRTRVGREIYNRNRELNKGNVKGARKRSKKIRELLQTNK
tara:strand:+ start:2863 stop:6780 length:3918 start_codon:yes stop_codon:yes gene_type:complete